MCGTSGYIRLDDALNYPFANEDHNGSDSNRSEDFIAGCEAYRFWLLKLERSDAIELGKDYFEDDYEINHKLVDGRYVFNIKREEDENDFT